jgi:hypothetical protein
MRQPWWNDGQTGVVTWIEQRLNNDAMLIVIDDQRAVWATPDVAIFVLDDLLSDESTEAKVEHLLREGVEWIDPEQWTAIVENFQATPELLERVGPQLERLQRLREEGERAHRRTKAAAIFRSKPVKYGVTVGTMGLAVVALGTLLSYRPTGQTRWRDIDRAGEGVPMVIRNVVLVVLLGGLDLLFTLAAQQAGGLLELNPLGSQLVASPVLLTSFKATSLLGSCFILVILRRYRGAQVASWWLCLVCTVLAFRWLTYNSMFLG